MIVCHQYKFIFFKTKKTAGTSMEIALSKFCGKGDIISPLSKEEEKERFAFSGLNAQNHLSPPWDYSLYDFLRCVWYRFLKGYYDHISVGEAKQILPKGVWETYFKFAVDRNPWDKVISFYHWSGGDGKYGNLSSFLREGRVHEVSSFEQLTHHGILGVDRIFKYEELESSLNEITHLLRLPEQLTLPAYRAKGSFRKDARPYREVLTPEEAEQIRLMFAREIALLGYEY